MATRNHHTSAIEAFPPELLVMTMSHLKPADILSLVLTSKRIRDAVRDHQTVLAGVWLRNHCDPSVVQLAIAHHAAETAEWKPPKWKPDPKLRDIQEFCYRYMSAPRGAAPSLAGSSIEEIRELCYQYITARPGEVSLPRRSRNLRSVSRVCAFYDASLRAARQFVDFNSAEAEVRQILDMECAQKAVYVNAIACHILHSKGAGRRRGEGEDPAWDRFSQYFSPDEQVVFACMAIFLEYLMSETLCDLMFGYGQGTKRLLVYGVERLIMPASSDRPRQDEKDRLMETVRINYHLRGYLWQEHGAALERVRSRTWEALERHFNADAQHEAQA